MLWRFTIAEPLFAFTWARVTAGHPCLTALRRPWLRADRRRLALTSLSRQPATTLGSPRPPLGRPRWVHERRGSRAEQDSAARLRRSARRQGCRSAVKRGTRAGHPSGRQAMRRNFIRIQPISAGAFTRRVPAKFQTCLLGKKKAVPAGTAFLMHRPPAQLHACCTEPCLHGQAIRSQPWMRYAVTERDNLL